MSSRGGSMKKDVVAMPLISVIVPVYNVARYLPRCLESLINQTYKNIEIILVDDGSTDGSGDICDEYAASDDRVRVFHIPNGGVSNARNLALDNSFGEYITFVDSDDWINDTWLEVALGKIRLQDSELFVSNVIRVTGIVENDIISVNDEFCTGIDFLKKMFKQSTCCWAIWGKLWKSSLWNDVRFNCNLVMNEDMDVFWMQLMKKVKSVSCGRNASYYYFARAGSAVSTVSKKHLMDLYNVESKVLDDNKWHEDIVLEKLVCSLFLRHRVLLLCKLACLNNSEDFIDREQKKIRKNFAHYAISCCINKGPKGLIIALIGIMPQKFMKIIGEKMK